MLKVLFTMETLVNDILNPGFIGAVMVHGVLLAAGKADSTFNAERDAALRALDALKDDPEFLSQTCDCRASARGHAQGENDRKMRRSM